MLLQKFELKSASGTWVTVIEPDRVVDLAEEEAKVVFFNAGGRVPEGRYVNFRLTLEDGAGGPGARPFCVSRREDFAEPVDIRKGSFLSAAVSPGRERPHRTVERAALTVDERTLEMKAEDIRVED